jgi:glyoxylase-like metal-dependent hydrolase (beta-lactamase superfamily II)
LKKPVEIAKNIYLIDDFDLKMPERTGTYVLNEQQLTIIETCASPSVPYILEGLHALGLDPQDIQWIILTHIHLDHAGGAGLFLQHCPNAKVIVHEKGMRHLADPSRLISGARAVYGDKFDALFDPVLSIPNDRLLVKYDREELQLSKDCTLQFFYTPGHADHHLSIYHKQVNGMFTGDTAGVRYPQLSKDQIELYLPSTSPNQFSPNKMLDSVQLYESMNLDFIFFGHYGLSDTPQEVYKQIRYWLPIFIKEGEAAYELGSNLMERIELTSSRLIHLLTAHLAKSGINKEHGVFQVLQLDINVCSMGIVDYIEKQLKLQ